jgi:hypothetical protein
LTRPPTGTDYVDSCIDRRGFLLEQRSHVGGKIGETKRALVVDTATSEFSVGGALVPRGQSGRVTKLTADSRPPGQSFWSLPEAPTGFTRVGRYAVAGPRPPVSFSADPRNVTATSVDEVFVRGIDVLVVSQGNGPLALRTTGSRVEAGDLGRGRLQVSASGSSLVVRLPGASHYVEVRGTVTPSTLINVARQLHEGPPGTLVTVPGGILDS